MEVILLERVEKLGQMGDVVRVKDGYARNYLLPKAKALRATKANLARFQTERVQLEARNLELKKEAAAVGQKLDGKSFIIIRQAGDTGQLYGSVSTRDIADQVVAGGTTIVRGQVILDRPIKSLGLHPIRVSLHPEVAVMITINVARTVDEAERQARGEDVTADRFEEEEEETVPVEELFEEGAAKPVTEDEETVEAEADRD
jgi:large subunit ribosomal protein L9